MGAGLFTVSRLSFHGQISGGGVRLSLFPGCASATLSLRNASAKDRREVIATKLLDAGLTAIRRQGRSIPNQGEIHP